MSRRLRSPSEWLGRARQRGAIAWERLVGPEAGEHLAAADLRPCLPMPLPTPEAIAAHYRRHPEARAALRERCRRIATGRFDLLGHRDLAFGQPVDWHLDPVHQRRAPRVHWSRVPYLDVAAVGDHKVIWELNRHQCLLPLALAWQVDGEEAHLAHLAHLLTAWLDANPPGVGINWASSLELSFRAIAWTWLLHLTGDALPMALRGRLVSCLDQHGRHIERHLSTWFSPNTHLTGEALGLLYLGTAWPALHRATRWRVLGWRILVERLPEHLRPDGTYFEQSTWYLGYTLDFALHAVCLARAGQLAIPAVFEARIRAAATVLAALARPDGTIPLIGDDDGGRLLPLGPEPVTSFADTLAHAATILSTPELALGVALPSSAIWLGGSSDQPAATRTAPRAPLACPDGGWFLLGGTAGDLDCRCVVDAGPHGALTGAHAHADPLAIDVTIDGIPVLADPGTFTYMGPERDRFRGTAVHSTLCLPNAEAALPAGPFGWRRVPVTGVHAWECGTGYAWLAGAHDGWAATVPGLRHARGVLWLEGVGLVVVDRLLGAPAPEGTTLHWHAAPGLSLSVGAHQDGILLTHGQRPLAALSTTSGQRPTWGAALSSPCYGAALPSQVIRDQPTTDRLAYGVMTLIAPVRGEGVAPTLAAAGGGVVVGAGLEGRLTLDATHLRWAVTGGTRPGVPAALTLPLGGGA